MAQKGFSFSESIPYDPGAPGIFSPHIGSMSPGAPKSLEPVSESSTIAPDVKNELQQRLTEQQQAELSRQFGIYLQQLHKNSGRETRRQPRVGRRELDLYQLYRFVQQRGGYNAITQWKDLGADLKLPETVTNAGYILRTKYEQFILPFEHDLKRRFPVDRPEADLIVAQPQQDDNWMVAYGNNYNNYAPYQSFQANQNLSYYNHVPESMRSSKPHFAGSQLKTLTLKDFPFTTESFEELVGKNQNLQELEAGSLKNLTRAPSSGCFPQNLRRLVLYDVPSSIANDLLMSIQYLSLSELNIQILHDKPPAAVPCDANENRLERYSFIPSSLD